MAKESKSKYEKLPPAFKKQWLKALRSNKFIQGKTGGLRLREEDQNDDSDNPKMITTHCCLGVACQIAGASGITNKSFIESDDRPIKSINKVPKMLHGETDLTKKLAWMNDGKKSTFSSIADWIEKHL